MSPEITNAFRMAPEKIWPKSVLMKSTKQPIHTRKQVAEAAGVSEDTVRKNGK